MTSGDLGDPEMLDRIRAAVSNEADGSDDLVDMLMVGFDLTFVDDYLVAQIVDDSAEGETAAVRSPTLESRFLSCEVGNDRFELEVVGGEIIGSIEPPRPGRMTLFQTAEAGTSDVSETGAFSLALASAAPFRLLFTDTSGATIGTVWILP